MTCIKGPSYREAVEALQALKEEEANTREQLSISNCAYGDHFHLKYDHGFARKVACSTKRTMWSKAEAKTKLKEMRRAGRRGLNIYPCWYSEQGQQHFHLGHRNSVHRYVRSGGVIE